jgi:hypothetical protein
MKLPEDFAWVQSQPTDGWVGARLELHGCPVIQVQPCRSGWLVRILLADPDNPQANVAVRSVAAGMRWSARWARDRVGRLRVLVDQPGRDSAAREAMAVRTTAPPVSGQPFVL